MSSPPCTSMQVHGVHTRPHTPLYTRAHTYIRAHTCTNLTPYPKNSSEHTRAPIPIYTRTHTLNVCANKNTQRQTGSLRNSIILEHAHAHILYPSAYMYTCIHVHMLTHSRQRMHASKNEYGLKKYFEAYSSHHICLNRCLHGHHIFPILAQSCKYPGRFCI